MPCLQMTKQYCLMGGRPKGKKQSRSLLPPKTSGKDTIVAIFHCILNASYRVWGGMGGPFPIIPLCPSLRCKGKRVFFSSCLVMRLQSVFSLPLVSHVSTLLQPVSSTHWSQPVLQEHCIAASIG